MEIARIGEQPLIRRMAAALSSVDRSETALVGIGDDAALVRWESPYALLQTDQQVEGVHFERTWAGAGDVGWKALTVNLSDIASMGGVPHFALVSLALPAETDVGWVDDLYAGIAEAALTYGVEVVGGDTSVSNTIVVNVAAFGSLPMLDDGEPRPMLRSNGIAGDVVGVTGNFGGAGACLRLFGDGNRQPSEVLRQALLRPQPRLTEGLVLREEGVLAAIDVSDGLLSDLGRLCLASGVAAVVDASAVPIGPEVMTRFPAGEALEIAVSGGEDYELLFTASEELIERVKVRTNTPISKIGRLVEGEPGDVRVETSTGVAIEIPASGWRHF
jgi:thiamine-monophosphate kinase